MWLIKQVFYGFEIARQKINKKPIVELARQNAFSLIGFLGMSTLMPLNKCEFFVYLVSSISKYFNKKLDHGGNVLIFNACLYYD